MIDEKRTFELLAALEHQQWIDWSKDIAATENITPARLERWKLLWRHYEHLSEAEKDLDREWASRVWGIVESELKRLNAEVAALREWQNKALAAVKREAERWPTCTCEVCAGARKLLAQAEEL